MPQRVQEIIIDFCQVVSVNTTAFIIALSNVETALKIISLAAATGYTVWKWHKEIKELKGKK